MLPDADSFVVPEQPVVLGLSGGRDSVALLRLLLLHDVQTFACHVHHGIRGEAADAGARGWGRRTRSTMWMCRAAHVSEANP